MNRMSALTNEGKSSYIAEIDSLRAIAVLSVMICHLRSTFLPGGFIGVDIFFVISGYVVSRSLAGSSHRRFFDFLTHFYARRFARILPALFLCILTTAVLTIAFIPNSWLSEAVQSTGRYAFFGLSNFALLQFDDGYFSPRSDYNPFTHTWSLAVEEQFYLFFPLLFFVFLKLRDRAGRWKALANCAVLTLGLASLACSWWLSAHAPQQAYYSLVSRFWELAAGAVLLQAHMAGKHKPSSAQAAVANVSVGLLLIVVGFVFTDPTQFPFPWAVVPVLGTVLMLNGVSAAQFNTSRLHSIMRWRPLTYIGKASYSLYLWHWPVFILFRWTMGLETAGPMLGAVLVTFVLASFSYRFVEIPFRRGAFALPRRELAVLATGIFSAAVLVTGYNFGFAHRAALTLSVTGNTQDWYPDVYETEANYPGPTFEGRTIFAVGDSHLGAYTTMLHETSVALKVQLFSYQTGGCQIGRLYYLMDQSPQCRQVLENFLADVRDKSKPGDIVFFASLRAHRLVDHWVKFGVDAMRDFNGSQRYARLLNSALDETGAIVQQLQSLGVTVLIDEPKPTFLAPPYRCMDWFNRMNPICSDGLTASRDMLMELAQPMRLTLAKLEQRFDNVVLWDPFTTLCPGEICSTFDDEGPLFYDGDHLSGHGNMVLLPDFERKITEIFSAPALTAAQASR